VNPEVNCAAGKKIYVQNSLKKNGWTRNFGNRHIQFKNVSHVRQGVVKIVGVDFDPVTIFVLDSAIRTQVRT
jgi:hypothetical protein